MFLRLEFACAAILLTAIVLLVALAAVARGFGAPIIWSIEIAQLLFIWLCMLSADIALQQARHFGLSLVADRVGARAALAIRMINIVLVMALLLFLLWYCVDLVRLSHARLYGATRLHLSMVMAALPFGIVLMVRSLAVELHGLWRERL